MDNAHILLKQQQGDFLAPNPDPSRSENMFQTPKTNKTTKLDKFNSSDIPELPGAYPKKNTDIVHETAGANLHDETLPNPVEYITEKFNSLTSTIESLANKGDIEDFQQHLKENIEDPKNTKQSVGSIETLDTDSSKLPKFPRNIASVRNMPNKSKSSKLKSKKRLPSNKSPKVTPVSNADTVDEKINIAPLDSVVVDPSHTSDRTVIPPTSLTSEVPLNSTLPPLASEAGKSPVFLKNLQDELQDPLTPQFTESVSAIPEAFKQEQPEIGNDLDSELRNDTQPSTHQPMSLFDNVGKIDARRQSLDANSPDYKPYKYSSPVDETRFDKESPMESSRDISKNPILEDDLTDPSPFPSKPNESREVKEGSKSTDDTLNLAERSLPALSSVSHQPNLDPKEYTTGARGALDTLGGEPEMAILDTIQAGGESENKTAMLRNPNTDMVHVQATEVQEKLDESGPKTNLHSVDKLATVGGGLAPNTRHLNTESNYVKDTKHADVLDTAGKPNIATIPSDTPSLVQSKSDLHNSTGLSPTGSSKSLGYQFKIPVLQRRIAPGIPFSGRTVGESLVGHTYLQDAQDSIHESKLSNRDLKSSKSTNDPLLKNIQSKSVGTTASNTNPPTLKKEYSRSSIKGDGTDKIAPGIPFSGSSVADSLIGYTYHSNGNLNNDEYNQSNIDMNTNRSVNQSSFNADLDPSFLSSALGDSDEIRTHNSKLSTDGNLEPEFIATYTRVGEELNEVIQPHQYQIIDSQENPLEPIDDVNISSPSAQQKLLPDDCSQHSRTNPLMESSSNGDLNKASPILVRDSDPTHREAIVIEMKDPQVSANPVNPDNASNTRNISNTDKSKIYLKGQAVNEPADVTLGNYKEDLLISPKGYSDSNNISYEDDHIPVKKTSSIKIVSESLTASLGNYLA
ncbi:hypothetical protein CONCODRAFT_168427 [Conidiobolus coronatus NRRL 28638]|uniref:Uncharacterized protein n=1 Tax=Conidiobolus coronatus (strain ATCC 28846 / CBS 209.66 / NRRL 28638) TaxID=796925 RepID=A0A137PCI8_CONC2|nr:hypothetical protein CONCODRAFT_168427 [Conidiobolus coronatus NRRL 28638]|eukprot:KXN72709.1 hypothetical protein CONCODRAFT_168427 [Conidiobolus coronatus NRRL 28638]